MSSVRKDDYTYGPARDALTASERADLKVRDFRARSTVCRKLAEGWRADGHKDKAGWISAHANSLDEAADALAACIAALRTGALEMENDYRFAMGQALLEGSA